MQFWIYKGMFLFKYMHFYDEKYTFNLMWPQLTPSKPHRKHQLYHW